MRTALMSSAGGGEKYFRWRGTEISRVENLSDAVFGLAITLLVVSSQVPATFGELKELLRLFVPFAVCALVFGMIWHAHYKFFRRYGLNDNPTLLINALLLFVVIFYLYPLKFLATLMFNVFTGRPDLAGVGRQDSDQLLGIYSSGYAAVFLLLAAFYWHAWRRREELELTGTERLITKQTLGLMLVHVITALLAVVASAAWQSGGFAGAVYFLIGPLSYLVGIHYGRKIKAAASPAVPVAAEIPPPAAVETATNETDP